MSEELSANASVCAPAIIGADIQNGCLMSATDSIAAGATQRNKGATFAAHAIELLKPTC